jgi:TPR repeat protein
MRVALLGLFGASILTACAAARQPDSAEPTHRAPALTVPRDSAAAAAGDTPVDPVRRMPAVEPVATPAAALDNQTMAQISCVDGDRSSCKRLTLLYGNALGEETMRTRFAARCQKGQASACYDLGWRLVLGLGGLERFPEEGWRLLRLGCDAGHAAACFDVAQSHRTGALTPSGEPDLASYQVLIARACDLGSQDACAEAPRQ